MKKNTDNLFTTLIFAILLISVYLTISGKWIAKDINFWQTTVLGNGKYFPILTIACLFVPPAMILLFIKYFLTQKKTLKTNKNENKQN
jgi:hypothetical protein